MVRLTCWLPLLLVIYILTRADAVSDQCSELHGEIAGVRNLNHRNELLLGQCYEQLKAETHISEAAFRSLKLEEDEFQSKLQQSEGVINNLKKQLEAKDEVLHSKNEKEKQLQTTIDVLTKTEEANKWTVQELREKQKQHQATIDVQTKREEANNRTVQDLREKQKQLQVTIDGLTKNVETLNQTVQLLCVYPKDACRCLLAAALYGDVNTAKILLKYASENCTGDDMSRNTPLIIAAKMGHVEVVGVLLEGGANAESANFDQWTALHYAAWNGYLEECRLLLDFGAKVDPVNKRKETPLHDAARWGHLSVVKLLVERGADVRLKNDKGLTASDLARSWEKKAVANWLDLVSRG